MKLSAFIQLLCLTAKKIYIPLISMKTKYYHDQLFEYVVCIILHVDWSILIFRAYLWNLGQYRENLIVYQ